MSNNNMYYAGFDVGTDAVHAVVIDKDKKIIYAPESLMHFGNPIGALKEIYKKIINRLGLNNIAATVFTGSAGEFIAKQTKIPFFHDPITIPLGASLIAPEASYIIHSGAKDSYFFEKEKLRTEHGLKSYVPDHGTGTKCGGGSGIMITKQCRRFFENNFPIKLSMGGEKNREILQRQLKNIFKKAEKEIIRSDKDIDVGGRCGVVIQSDMIHLQNSGEQISNILKGMFVRVIKNYKSDVIKTRSLDKNKKAIVTGGIFGNKYLAGILKKELGVSIEVPRDYQKIGAVGAAVKARRETTKLKIEELSLIADAEKDKIKRAPSLSSALNKVKIYNENKAIARKDDLTIYNVNKNKKTEVLLGIDGGSTTTKAVVMDMDAKIMAEICLYTNGRPLMAAQKIFKEIRKHLGEYIRIKGVAFTGSSGAFYYKLFTDNKKNPDKINVDLIKDEITCHALGARCFNKKIDTIFELGGQDAKFTLFDRSGSVKKAKMNLSCMAGTGQTMHNMVEMIGLDIKTTFHDYALSAKYTPIVDETCGIFTEAGIAKLIALGFPKEEVAAAIAYGFMGGYVNKFIGNEQFGSYASAQGGPFLGKACLAALALHTGLAIHAFPHRQLFGALGAAIAVNNRIKELKRQGADFESKFRGLDIADMEFKEKQEKCGKIVKDNCGLRECDLRVYKIDNDSIYSGGLCPKGNTETATASKRPDYVALYNNILNKHLIKYSNELSRNSNKVRVLIPRSLTFLNEKGVFYTALYKALGFDVCLSPESSDEIANLGINNAHPETCYPVKLAHGHAAYLKKYLRKKKDKILLVNIIGAGKEKYKFCPYVAAAGFLVKDVLYIDNKDALLPVIHFNDPDYKIEAYILKDLNRVFSKRFSLTEIKKAIKIALEAENKFLREIHATGKTIINSLKQKGEKIFIGIGRGYTLLDNKSSSKVHELFASSGLHFLPALFLDTLNYDIDKIVDNMYWYQGQRIIKYNLKIAMTPNFYPVRETNFNCGTDSFLLYHEEDIMNMAGKPRLVLQTDGHNSNAQFGTRIQANYEVVKKHKTSKVSMGNFCKSVPSSKLGNKYLGIPYIGDASCVVAASLRTVGFKAEVMPTQTKRAQELARKFTGSNICLPFFFQVGDSLAWLYQLKEKGIDPNKNAVIIEPGSKGPCRYGQYSVVLKKIINNNGFNDVPIFSPDADEDYNNLPVSKLNLFKLSTLIYRGIYCCSLLLDGMLRTRPYEKEKGGAEKEYSALSAKLFEFIENNTAGVKKLTGFMEYAKERFAALIDHSKNRKPVVLMNGEIFVRAHPKANRDSIKLLEKYGLEVMLVPFSQWLEYINNLSITLFKKSKNWKKLAASVIKKTYMDNASAKLHAPFITYLEGREFHNPERIVEAVQKTLIYEKTISGESVLSIGEAYLFSKGNLRGICGIYHVSPFGCMHETTATSKIQALIGRQRLRAKTINEKIIPFIDGVFGDSELPNLEAEIAAFAEKCYIKQNLNKRMSG